ncbi:hypothetical protein FO519_003278 [Halicephalobus sp. NKZ332]|nr:hypothetical protein FO519_003278 [Halicephalobus sp. NKZ332]
MEKAPRPPVQGEQRLPVKSKEDISFPGKYYCSIPLVTLAAYDKERNAYKRDPIGIGSLCIFNPSRDVLVLQLSRRDEIYNLQFIFTKDSAYTLESGTLIFVTEKYGVCAFATSADGGLKKAYSFLLGLRDGTLEEKIAQEEMEKNQKTNAQNVLTKLFSNINHVQGDSRDHTPVGSTMNVANNSVRMSSANATPEKPQNQGSKALRNRKNDKTPVQASLKGVKISPNDLFSQKNGAKKTPLNPQATPMGNVMSMLNEAVAATSVLDALADEEVSRISAAANCLTPSSDQERSSSQLSGASSTCLDGNRVLYSFVYLLGLERVDAQRFLVAPNPRPRVNKMRETFGIVEASLITPDDLYRTVINCAFDEYKNQRFPNLYLFPGVDATSTLVAASNMIKQNRISETAVRHYSRGDDGSDRSSEVPSLSDNGPRAEIQSTPSVLVPRRRTRIPGSRSPETTSTSTPTPGNGRRSILPGCR